MKTFPVLSLLDFSISSAAQPIQRLINDTGIFCLHSRAIRMRLDNFLTCDS
jgi:hypothetical protein